MSAQREAFEAHVLIWWRAINRDSTGDYVAAGTSDAWELWQAAQAAMQDELVQLRGFAAATMDYWPEDSIDGGELQDIAAAHGLLKLETVYQRCGEVCRCADHVTDAEFAVGGECYRKSQVLLDAEIARNAKEAL